MSIGSANDYYELYKASQERIRQEELVSESLLYSIKREIRLSEVQFLADIVGYYYDKGTRNSWSKVFFDKMNELFFGTVDWTIGDIIRCGAECYAYRIEFKMNDEKYSLMIPNTDEITIKNIGYADYGRICLSKNITGCAWKSVCSSYVSSDIASAIKKEFLE